MPTSVAVARCSASRFATSSPTTRWGVCAFGRLPDRALVGALVEPPLVRARRVGIGGPAAALPYYGSRSSADDGATSLTMTVETLHRCRAAKLAMLPTSCASTVIARLGISGDVLTFAMWTSNAVRSSGILNSEGGYPHRLRIPPLCEQGIEVRVAASPDNGDGAILGQDSVPSSAARAARHCEDGTPRQRS
jgi:hypothetical protein